MQVAVVTAIREEYAAVLKFLEDVQMEELDGVVFARGKLKLPPYAKVKRIEVIAPSPSSAGNVASAIVSTRLAKHRPDVIAMIGCAGGVPKKVNLYDVVFADRVIYYEPGKDSVDGFIPRPDQHKPFDALLQRARIESIEEDWKRLIPDPVNSPFFARVEPIAAGEVLLNAPKSDLLKQVKLIASRAVAVEMEGFGVMEAAYRLGLRGIVVRGISDMLDKSPDQDANGDYIAGLNATQVSATTNAMAFLVHLLSQADVNGLREVDRGADAELYVEIDCKPGDFARVVADLAALGKGLSFQNIRIVVGSVKVFAEVDPVLAVVIETFWLSGESRQLLNLNVTAVTVEGADTPAAQEMSQILRSALNDDASAVTTTEALRQFSGEHPQYQGLISQVESSLKAVSNARQVELAVSRKRISLAIDEKTKIALTQRSVSEQKSMAATIRELINEARIANVDLKEIQNALDESGGGTERVNTSVDGKLWSWLSALAAELAVRSVSKLAEALVRSIIS
jgi:nucleoside phosphorylase